MGSHGEPKVKEHIEDLVELGALQTKYSVQSAYQAAATNGGNVSRAK